MDSPAVIKNYTPTILDRWLHVTQSGYSGVIRYHSRRSGVGVRAIVVHIQEGNNWGSWQHFHSVKASSTVLIGKNGDIWRLVDESKAPWTNGDVNRPDQQAIALMNRYGWDPNTWTLTIENEGFSGGLPYTDAQFKSNVWQIWQWLTKYPTIEEVHILRHGQINSVTRARCPEGPPYTFMGRIMNALKGADTGGGTTPTEGVRDPWPVIMDNGKEWDGTKDVTINGIPFYADKRQVTIDAPAGLLKRQWASTQSNLTDAESMKHGSKQNVLGWVEGEEIDGDRRWWVGTSGSRFSARYTKEKPKKNAPVPTKPDDGVSKPDTGNNREVIPVVLNGNVYTPVEVADEDGKARKRVTTLTPSNTRLWAATHSYSPVQRTIPANTDIWVTHHVKGEPLTLTYWVDGENRRFSTDKWYVIEPADGKDPIHRGERIWAGLVDLQD